MAAAQLAARPYGSFRSYRHDLYPYSGDICAAHHHNSTTHQPSTFGHSSATFISNSAASARQRPPIVIASNAAKAHITTYHHPITMAAVHQQQQQRMPASKLGRTADSETSSKKIVVLSNPAFIRNSHATASWDGTLRSSGFTTNSNGAQVRRTAATATVQRLANSSLRGSGKFAAHKANPACLAHRSPQCSSAGTSVESIVPKYTQSSAGAAASGASQKRSYNQHKPVRELATAFGSASKKQPATAVAVASFGAMSSSNTSTSSSTFSSKFPAGMPFESEFYQPTTVLSSALHRSNSITSDASKYSSYSAYDNHQHMEHSHIRSGVGGGVGRIRPQPLPFEDEFMRKPSNEPLYVDFSKEIPRMCDQHDQQRSLQRASDSPVTPPATLMASLAKSRHFFGREQRPILRSERLQSGVQQRPKVTTGLNVTVCDKPSRILVNHKPVPAAAARRPSDYKDPMIVVAIASWNCSHNTNANESTSLVSNRLKLYVYITYLTHSLSACRISRLSVWSANKTGALTVHKRLTRLVQFAHGTGREKTTHTHKKIANAEIIPDT